MIRVHFNFSLKSVWTQNWLKKRQKPFPVLILSPTSIPVHAFFRFLAKKKWLYYYNFLSFPIAPKRNSITLASPPLQPPPAPLTDILLLWWPPTTSPIISYPHRFPPTQASSLLTATSSHKRPPPMPEAARPSNTHTHTQASPPPPPRQHRAICRVSLRRAKSPCRYTNTLTTSHMRYTFN